MDMANARLLVAGTKNKEQSRLQAILRQYLKHNKIKKNRHIIHLKVTFNTDLKIQ